MKLQAVLNRGGGTLRTRDLDALTRTIQNRFEEAGHCLKVNVVEGAEVVDALREARDGDCEGVLAGGGDGTISAAAGVLRDSGKALAVLPAGTMNLFARSLAIPLELDAALTVLAGGTIRTVDVATANDRAFVHQFSVGMHPRLIRLRERHAFHSKLGKIRASAHAAFELVNRPSRVTIQLDVDGEESTIRTHSLGVTNNLFVEGHLPFAERPDGGVLGVYMARSRRRADFLYFLANLAIGRWRANPQVEIRTARKVVVRVKGHNPRFGCAVDGELCELDRETVIRIHPRSLKVIVPAG